ncbi:FecR domain-containing protein [bacterium]|nr:FecR domain-containing protein [bacterium]
MASLALLFAAGCGSPDGSGNETEMVVVSVTGTGSKSGEPVKPGDAIGRGETLIVDEGSVVVARLAGQAAIQVKASSKLVFEELGDTFHLQLDYGSVLTASRPVPRFKISTPAAVVGVRGTTFYTEARGLDQSYVCLCDGEILIETQSGTETLQTPVLRHRAVTAAPAKEGEYKLTPAKFIGHTNVEISALQKILDAQR